MVPTTSQSWTYSALHTVHNYNYKEPAYIFFLKSMCLGSSYSYQYRGALYLEIPNANCPGTHSVWLKEITHCVAVTNELSQWVFRFYLISQFSPFKVRRGGRHGWRESYKHYESRAQIWIYLLVVWPGDKFSNSPKPQCAHSLNSGINSNLPGLFWDNMCPNL